jgi:hypothetical protein
VQRMRQAHIDGDDDGLGQRPPAGGVPIRHHRCRRHNVGPITKDARVGRPQVASGAHARPVYYGYCARGLVDDFELHIGAGCGVDGYAHVLKVREVREQ